MQMERANAKASQAKRKNGLVSGMDSSFLRWTCVCFFGGTGKTGTEHTHTALLPWLFPT